MLSFRQGRQYGGHHSSGPFSAIVAIGAAHPHQGRARVFATPGTMGRRLSMVELAVIGSKPKSCRRRWWCL